MTNLMADDVIIMLKEGLNREIPVESGTFNKFCNRCGYRNGHPLVWCNRCGNKMVVYTDQPIRFTWEQYIMMTNNIGERNDRIKSFIHHEANYHIKGFKFIWYTEHPDCTTPQFVEAIEQHLKANTQ